MNSFQSASPMWESKSLGYLWWREEQSVVFGGWVGWSFGGDVWETRTLKAPNLAYRIIHDNNTKAFHRHYLMWSSQQPCEVWRPGITSEEELEPWGSEIACPKSGSRSSASRTNSGSDISHTTTSDQDPWPSSIILSLGGWTEQGIWIPLVSLLSESSASY